ncbi:hypothetical protein AGABI2DRAFT_119644 [Agaricus bisporus var. bisporus H97]|uniref:hypothetical protein n=1 Tax=Agaricus bisporus var. bisporus (strain H97 / ATCC MYA-4626 / FGSC 10389) TaxID=936046 RepID=UPI00029F5247|nr:hypothetical protein AGABI2DRAFT_119644 [Agaricus bisporus var. bisporus H97]EKV45985.1 hypothetical protein AGABI2DRAFT_119644 [Agaricus bisporus var. bisporus H97]
MLESGCCAKLHKPLSPIIVVLLLVWVAFATAESAESTSYNDPCRVISLSAPKPAEPPMCYLKPLRLLEPVQEDLLLSFEEWKAKQHHGAETGPPAGVTSDNGSEVGDGMGNGSKPPKAEDASSIRSSGQEVHQSQASGRSKESPPHPSPQFPVPIVPIVDRFNYASLDCSARVHKAHKEAKHSSNILSSKKDRYLLSPCKTKEPQFVIIELCEDIRVDVVELANFEFFSGVFKDVTVSVAKTSWEEARWTVLGTWKAKNVRGIQTFRPPIPLKGFYRYLRIDFHSHYGSEYYCPVSLVAVYGFTHLEEWNWELYEAERTKLDAISPEASIHQTPDSAKTDSAGVIFGQETTLPTDSPEEDVIPSTLLTKILQPSTDPHILPPFIITQFYDFEAPYVAPSSTKTSTSSPTPFSATYHPTASPSSARISPASHPNTANTITSSPVETNVLPTCTTSSTVLMSTPVSGSQGSLPLSVSGGESIFRTIMNRVLELESNHTLYEQYMAQQQFLVREALKRLGEDIGRLEGVGKAHRQIHDRATQEWEKQRKRWQFEHAQLLQRIDYLTDEIIMEKRLGVAQLCLLLAVLVFMGLTRGSRGPIDADRRRWGTALKSFSDDWRHRRTESGTDGSHVRTLSSMLPVIPLRSAESGSNHSSGEIYEKISSATPPLTSIDLNILSHHDQRQQRRRGRGDHGSENVQNVYLQVDGGSRSRSRTTSGPRRRTSSRIRGQGSTSRQALEARHSRAPSVANTPTKGVRASPTVGSIRLNVYDSKRGDSVRRSHSSQGTIDLALEEAWGGSRGNGKSARTWARTAHLHEVKQKRQRNNSGSLFSGSINGDKHSEYSESTKDNDSDVFGGTEKPELLVTNTAGVETDADGWESASDVEY